MCTLTANKNILKYTTWKQNKTKQMKKTNIFRDCIGKQRALSLDIWLIPNMCVILGKRQFVALLRSAWEKYTCLNVQMTSECPY